MTLTTLDTLAAGGQLGTSNVRQWLLDNIIPLVLLSVALLLLWLGGGKGDNAGVMKRHEQAQHRRAFTRALHVPGPLDGQLLARYLRSDGATEDGKRLGKAGQDSDERPMSTRR